MSVRAVHVLARVRTALAFLVAAMLTGADAAAAGSLRHAPLDDRGSPRFSSTFIDPYSVFNATQTRLDAMFDAQRAAGITTVIVQWTAAERADGSFAATWPAGPETGYLPFDTVLERILRAAERYDTDVWLGLALRSELLDAPETRDDPVALRRVAEVTHAHASDLIRQFPGRFTGWYIPSEPGYQTVADPDRLARHMNFIGSIASQLKAVAPRVPVMISPSVPRAIEGDLTGVEFMDRLLPMMLNPHIDVWNLQVGYKMTAWSPGSNAALLRTGDRVARATGGAVWATFYVPGPGDSNYPIDLAELLLHMRAVDDVGVPMSMWTFDSSMNPDPARSGWEARAALFDAYVRSRRDV